MSVLVAAYWGRISDIEIAFTLISLGGLWFSFYNLRDAYWDRRAIEGERNGRAAIAQVAMRVEIARFVILLILASLGITAMTLREVPDVIDQPWNLVLIGILFRWGLIFVALLVLYQSVENRRLRQYLHTIPTKEVALYNHEAVAGVGKEVKT